MVHHNVIRIHQTIPGTAAGVVDHLWTMADVVEMIESRECEAASTFEAVTANRTITSSHRYLKKSPCLV